MLTRIKSTCNCRVAPRNVREYPCTNYRLKANILLMIFDFKLMKNANSSNLILLNQTRVHQKFRGMFHMSI